MGAEARAEFLAKYTSDANDEALMTLYSRVRKREFG